MELNSKTESDIIQEDYNKRIFLNALKTGKVSTLRKGLGRRIYLLCGLDPYNVPPAECSEWDGLYPKFSEPHRRIHYPYTSFYKNHSFVKINMDKLLIKESFEIYKKYLGIDNIEYPAVFKFNNSINIYFKKSHLIPWPEMDLALKEMYPKNYRVDSNGFVHFKRNPMIYIT